jgi:hypothetical protein
VTAQRPIDAVPGKVQIEAEVWPSGNTLIAFLAGDGGIDGDSPPPVRPRRDQGAELMTEDETIPDDGVSNSALAIPMPVRTAEANRKDLEQDLSVTRLRHG